MPKEEAAVWVAQQKGLDAYEALAPTVRRRGSLGMALRCLRQRQASWLVERLEARSGLSAPAFRYTGKDSAELARTFEARAQAWWLIEHLPDAALVEAQRLVEEAGQQPDRSDVEALRAQVVGDLRDLDSYQLQKFAFLIERLKKQPEIRLATLELLGELLHRGPHAVRQAESWCKRLWQLDAA